MLLMKMSEPNVLWLAVIMNAQRERERYNFDDLLFTVCLSFFGRIVVWYIQSHLDYKTQQQYIEIEMI